MEKRQKQSKAPFTSRLSRVLFGLCFLAVVFSVGVIDVAQAVGLPVPPWLRAEGAVLQLEGRSSAGVPTPSAEAWLTGQFQTQADDFLSDASPAHDDALLAHAALHRALIAPTAHLLGYTAYPTYYGSNVIYLSEADRVGKVPYRASDEFAAEYAQSADVLDGFAARHCDLDVYVLCVNAPNMSEYSPAAGLIAGPADFGLVRANLLDRLDPSITVVVHEIPSSQSLLEGWYRSDHHWKTENAYEAYRECIAVMDPLAEPVAIKRVVTLDDVAFNGSYARAGIMPARQPDRITDVDYDASNLRVITPEEEGGIELLVHADEYSNGEYPTGRFANHYVNYFHADEPFIEIENASAPNDESLMIVGNSYAAPMERFYAEHYRHIYRIDYRYYNGTVEDALDAYRPDKYLLILADHNFTEEEYLAFMGSEAR